MSGPRGPKPTALTLEPAQRQALLQLVHRHSAPQQLVLRARIILAAADGLNHAQIARHLGISLDMARTWRRRWLDQAKIPWETRDLAARLADLPRSGAPATLSAEQYTRIMAVVCELPAASGRPISQWTHREIAAEVIQRGIVDTISPRHLGRFLKGSRSPATP